MEHKKINPTRASFLDLPAELRNEIYELDLELPPLRGSRTLFVNQHRGSDVMSKRTSQACRQVREEMLTLHFERANVRLDAESNDDIYWTAEWLNTSLGRMLHLADRIELRHAHCAEHNFKVLNSECRGMRSWAVLGAEEGGSSKRERVVTSLGCVPCRRTWVIVPKVKEVEVVPEMDERDEMCDRDNHGQEKYFLERAREALRGDDAGRGFRDCLASLLDGFKAIPVVQGSELADAGSESGSRGSCVVL